MGVAQRKIELEDIQSETQQKVKFTRNVGFSRNKIIFEGGDACESYNIGKGE